MQSVSLPSVTLRDLELAFGAATLERGRRYQLEGRVVTLNVEDDETLHGQVQGTAEAPYRVSVRVQRERYGFEMQGQCECSVASNCKHAVALLCQAMELRDATPSRAVMDASVNDWLEEFETLARETAPASGATARGTILYLLLDGDEQTSQPPHAKTCVVRPDGAVSPYDPADVLSGDSHGVLAPADRDLLYEMADLGYRPQQGLALDGILGAALLARMVNSGRCRHGGSDGPLLRRGSPRAPTLRWRLHADSGQFGLRLDTEPPATAVMPFTPPWYVDAARGEVGPVATALPRALSEELLVAPELDAATAAAAVERLRELLAPFEVRVARPPRVRELRDSPCLPVLALTAAADGQGVALLHYEYDGVRIDPRQATERTVVGGDEGFVVVTRALEQEQQAARLLATLGLVLDGGEPPGARAASCWTPHHSRSTWPQFLIDALAVLRAEGWQLRFEADFPLRVLELDCWLVQPHPGADGATFEVELALAGTPRARGLLAAVATVLQQLDGSDLSTRRAGEHLALVLADGHVLPAPPARLQLLRGVLGDLGADLEALAGGARLRVSRFQAATLLELDAPQHGLRFAGPSELLDLGKRIAAFSGIRELPAPPGLGVALRGYQRQALGWLAFLADIGSGGCLADDMGLGKTVQALAHLLGEKLAGRADRPSLVVAPTSVLGNWVREAERVAPQLRVLLLHGPRRHASFEEIAAHDLCITSYALLPRDEARLSAQPFHLVILDEAQNIKNPRTRAAVVTRRIQARRTLALTGTPMENHLGELWALFSVLVPGLLGSEEGFRRQFRRPIERDHDEESGRALARRLAPFMLRRTKAAVAPELPPRTDILHTVHLGASQARIYERVRQEMEARLQRLLQRGSIEDARVEVLSALLRLRQVCCDPRLIGETGDRRASAKLDVLMELVPTLLEEGRRILLFSQFTSMLALIEQALVQEGVTLLKLTGESRDRQSLVDRFQAGEAPVFLVSLKAGGTGLNLTAADTVIHYDPWWNPAAQAQASDRAHRIGQTQPVFVHKLLTAGTVEERIHALQASKQRLADGLFEGRSESGLEWTAEQLQALLAPVG